MEPPTLESYCEIGEVMGMQHETKSAPQALTQDNVVKTIAERIAQAYHPERTLLFGSRAKGLARADSDYDLLIVKETDVPRHKRAAPLFALLADLPVEVDILVYTPAEIRDWGNVKNATVTRAIQEGITIYERKA